MVPPVGGFVVMVMVVAAATPALLTTILLMVYVDSDPTEAGLTVTLIPPAALIVIAYGAAVSVSWSPLVAPTKSLTV